MNLFHKRLKLSPSKTRPPARTPPSSPDHLSHDASLLPPPPAPTGSGAEEEGYLLVEEDTTDSSLIITMEDSQGEEKVARKRAMRKRKRKVNDEGGDDGGGASESEEEAEPKVDLEIVRQLEQSLETKSKQHNLTTVNVRNIIHEVITNEHVVAMMKAAINETEAVPPFEPKMTRSKFKEVVEKGVVIPAWNISPIKKSSDVNKAPQFVDIPLAEEDSSDEEYRPDEDDEDETAEDTFQESDMESTASSPRGSRLSRGEEESCSPWQVSRSRSRRLRAKSVSMGPPPPPKALPPKAVPDNTFLEKLHAVEEELAVCMEPYQPMSESEEEVGLMAYRTRSKRPLRDVPLGRLEAELRAPDITPDMYDSNSALEDRDWTDWLRGLMTSDMDNEEEGDDEDDPEYNFLADIDEPDLEDYRDDKAVRITKKEVNELMEELFETLKEDLAGQEVEEEGHEEEEEPQEEAHTVLSHVPEEQHNSEVVEDEPDNRPITELHTVKQQLELIRKRQQLGLPTQTLCNTHTICNAHTHCADPHTLKLDVRQRIKLQQQLQQHVQLLTQIHLLSSPVTKLQSEAETTRQFLCELELLAQRAELLMSSADPSFCSIFRASNLQGALQLLEELRQNPINYQLQPRPPDARGHMRSYPVMPTELAWLFATRSVFLHPELLPSASLDPALYCPRRTAAFTAAEDCLLVLGLRNMEGTCDPARMVSHFLLRKTLVQVRRRILQCCRPGFPDNIVKAFRYQKVVQPMLVACRGVSATEQRPPVEREENVLPLWLLRSLPVIYPTIKQYNSPSVSDPEAPPPCRSGGARQSHLTFLRSASQNYSFPPGTRYPPRLPKHLDFRRIGFLLLHPPSDSSPLPDGQADSSTSSTRHKRQVDSSPSSPLPNGKVDSSPLPDGQVDPSPSLPLPEGQIDTSSLPDKQAAFSSPILLPEKQVDSSPSSPLPERQEDSSPLPDRQVDSSPPPHLLLRRLLLSRTDTPTDIINTSDVSMTTRDKIRRHYLTLTSLRGRGSEVPVSLPPPGGFAFAMLEDLEADDVVRTIEEEEEEEEEESEVLLALSESSPSSVGSVASDDELSNQGEAGSACEQEVKVTPEKEKGWSNVQETLLSEDHRICEDEAFAQDYLLRVCDAVQVCPGLSEQLQQVLDQFSTAGPQAPPELLFESLSGVLQPWPQLLRDFAAFLSLDQARRCHLLAEQQLFERSRHFLRRLGQSLGEGSCLYQQVVSVLQGSSAPPPEDMDKISELLRHHPDLQEEFREFFQQLQAQMSPVATSSDITGTNYVSQNNTDTSRRTGEHQTSEESETGSEREEEAESFPRGKKDIWTREADRAILTACQQRGANYTTFRQVSTHLGNKTTHQVSRRFRHLMDLFHIQKSTSCS